MWGLFQGGTADGVPEEEVDPTGGVRDREQPWLPVDTHRWWFWCAARTRSSESTYMTFTPLTIVHAQEAFRAQPAQQSSPTTRRSSRSRRRWLSVGSWRSK